MTEELTKQTTRDGTNFVKLLNAKGIVVGVDVSKG